MLEFHSALTRTHKKWWLWGKHTTFMAHFGLQQTMLQSSHARINLDNLVNLMTTVDIVVDAISLCAIDFLVNPGYIMVYQNQSFSGVCSLIKGTGTNHIILPWRFVLVPQAQSPTRGVWGPSPMYRFCWTNFSGWNCVCLCVPLYWLRQLYTQIITSIRAYCDVHLICFRHGQDIYKKDKTL